MRDQIRDIVAVIRPLDDLEHAHIQDAISWIDKGNPIFRISKPDNPPKHLVSYFVPYDQSVGKIMLIDHKKSGLWLPPGGHIETDEDPRITVIREAEEELGVTLNDDSVGASPLFITVTDTVGITAGHTDVSLWYVVSMDSAVIYQNDESEFDSYKWLALDQVLALPINELDPHLHRFVQKLKSPR